MGRRNTGLVIDVRQNLEAEVLILVKQMQAARRILAMLLHEVLVLQQVLELGAHFLAAAGARIARQDGMAVRYELIELISHGGLPAGSLRLVSVSRIRAAGASSL